MGLHLSQLFLRRFDWKALSKSIGPAWFRHIDADRENPQRQLLLLFRPPWLLLLDSSNQVPRELALEATASAGGEAIWVGLAATTLCCHVVRAVEGETVEDRLHPAADAGGRMPLYVDAEQEAWDRLRRFGVPPELRLLRPRELDSEAPGPGRDSNMVLFERPALGKPVHHGFFHFTVTHPKTEESGPPTEYTMMSEEKKFLADGYIISGRPDAERVDHLLGVLDAIARRKLRPDGFSYSVLIAGEGEDLLQRLVKERYAALNPQRTFAFRV